MRTMHFKTADEMHDEMCRRMLFSDHDDYDSTTASDVSMHDVALECDSFQWDQSIKRFWVADSRWRTMVKQYVGDAGRVGTWLELIESQMTGKKGRKTTSTAMFRFEDVLPRRGGKTMTRRWGPCMLGVGVRNYPTPEVSFISRTSYFGYLSVLDLSVAWKLADLAADVLGRDVEDFRMTWKIEQAQFHGFRSLAYVLGDDAIAGEVENHRGGNLFPGVKKAQQGRERIDKEDRVDKPYADVKFKSYLRVRKRYHAEMWDLADYEHLAVGDKVFAPLPECRTSDLDFRCIGVAG